MGRTDSEAEPPEPPRIRALRRLVTALTLVLIAGMVIVTGLLAWRLSGPLGPPAPALPDEIRLPAGERLTGYARNPEWTVLITEDAAGAQRLHLVPAGGEEIAQTVPITANE